MAAWSDSWSASNGRAEIDAHGRDAERLRDERRVLFVLRLAVAGQQHAEDVAVHRHLTQPRDDSRVDAAAQADDESARAGGVHALAKPGRDSGRSIRHRHHYKRQWTTRARRRR